MANSFLAHRGRGCALSFQHGENWINTTAPWSTAGIHAPFPAVARTRAPPAASCAWEQEGQPQLPRASPWPCTSTAVLAPTPCTRHSPLRVAPEAVLEQHSWGMASPAAVLGATSQSVSPFCRDHASFKGAGAPAKPLGGQTGPALGSGVGCSVATAASAAQCWCQLCFTCWGLVTTGSCSCEKPRLSRQ